MTDAPTIKPGDRLHGVEVLSPDPTDKRCAIACPCGSTHLVGVEALISGHVLFPARPSRSPHPATGNTKEQMK